jgi:starch synthase
VRTISGIELTGVGQLKILLASSEVYPFAKTGGLADVCGALPIELAKLGHEVTVIMPAYRTVHHGGQTISDTGIRVEIPIGNNVVEGQYLRSHLPGSDVPVYLVDQPRYFDRDELYRESGRDYRDNCERFVFFCRAAMESIRLFELNTDLIHANDWQTGLMPAFQKIEYENAPGYEHIATLLTIHNIAYQGQFWHWDMLLTGLDWKYFNWRQMEYYGDLNLLKTGIVFADSLNTVSPRYAEEIQQSPLGCGLEGVLSHRRNVLSGIINGADYSIWNPATDPHLAALYTPDDWQTGKARCKAALQQEVGLPMTPEVPLIGLIGRLADQKGYDLVAQVLKQWGLSNDVQWVILGTGEPQYHTLFRELSSAYPSRVAARLEFSDALAHQIEAGCDMFLMPSRYEPCGLNQLYSLKYGTVPVVHKTGGLADTIVDASGEAVSNRQATGFVFDHYDAASLDHALSRACQVFRDDRALWSQLVETGMNQDWSWAESARKYVELYETTIARATQLCA